MTQHYQLQCLNFNYSFIIHEVADQSASEVRQTTLSQPLHRLHTYVHFNTNSVDWHSIQQAATLSKSGKICIFNHDAFVLIGSSPHLQGHYRRYTPLLCGYRCCYLTSSMHPPFVLPFVWIVSSGSTQPFNIFYLMFICAKPIFFFNFPPAGWSGLMTCTAVFASMRECRLQFCASLVLLAVGTHAYPAYLGCDVTNDWEVGTASE